MNLIQQKINNGEGFLKMKKAGWIKASELTSKMIVGDLSSLEEIIPLVNKPTYICHFCKRVANKAENLCFPEKLDITNHKHY